jgi:predicted metal-binding protein
MYPFSQAMTDTMRSFLEELKKNALNFGATDAKTISTKIISIQDDIIELCREPLCEGFGTSIYCPPHAMKPDEFREEIRQYQHALFFKTDVDPEILLSDRRYEAFRTIYEITTQLEAISLDAGYSISKGLAAGSCKPVFCMNYECQALIDGTSCRYPSRARPSMEALGINVFKLIEDVGWEIHPITSESDPASVPGGLLAGMVLVA